MLTHSGRLFRPLLSFAALAALSLLAVQDIKAELIADPAGDFLPSYTGPKNGDLDVVSAQVFFNGSSFTFTSAQAAPIGLTTGAVYVWGVDRGAGRQGFPVIAPGVLFDSVFIINPAGGSSVRDLISNTGTAINDISFSGSTISGTVPLSTLPSLGRAPSQYTVNLWPRFSGVTGDAAIPDFAPNNTSVLVTSATPEPSTISLLGMAVCGTLGILRLRRRNNSQ
jgi:PEP-CTERM motif